MQLTIVRTMESLQEALVDLARAGKRVGMVPTMGALHAGHMSLIKRARGESDAVVATIFVNPKQFGPAEDFAKYPRMLDDDIKKMDAAGAAIVYTPDMEDMYPPDFSTTVSVGELGKILEGRSRPVFFDGVATVVSKLFLRILPHVAVFGEKDYQQLCVVNRLVSDLDLPIEIIGAPTVREDDGLAMASRNAYLTPQERAIAPMLYEVLNHVQRAIVVSHMPVKSALEQGVSALTKAGFKVDYLEMREAETLAEIQQFEPPARLLAAAWLGATRLIDNIAME